MILLVIVRKIIMSDVWKLLIRNYVQLLLDDW